MIPRFGDGRDWFFEKRFGLFVHWGLYAIPAWHEQVQWRRAVPREEYGRLIREFNPVKFDPDVWLDVAQGCGMEYLCVTTKHHVHLFKDPESRAVILKPLDTLPARATLLNTGAPLDVRVDVTPRLWQEPAYLRVRDLPVEALTDEPMVLKLEFERLPAAE